ncbi:MAG: hypothetical protein QM756_19020 [Polyangiaceae bacterium]
MPAPSEPHGFVEPCTIANQQEMHTECELCKVPHGSPDACKHSLGKRGYQYKCRTQPHGGGELAEVWCAEKHEQAPRTPAGPFNGPFLGGLLIAILAFAFVGSQPKPSAKH